jgi:hypothetical protein
MTIRGSSAIFDAGSSVFVLGAEKGKPIPVEHEKDRNRGVTVDPVLSEDRGSGYRRRF